MSVPKVSVVIPAYNAARFIVGTLETIRAQTFNDHETVVVDDGSSDDTKAVVDAFLSRHGLAGTCIRQSNKRIAGARNTGMRAARGEFIALLDHDDLWYPEKLAKCMCAFAEHPEVDLVGHHIDILRNGRRLRTARKGPAAPDMYETLLLKGNALAPSAAVFRKEKALSIGGFRENPEFNTVEDYDFWMRLSRVARFHFIDEALAGYAVVDDSASSRVDYHHGNLETLLREHFASRFGPHPDLLQRLRMRRRLSAVYRSALGQLLAADVPQSKRTEYALKMLRAFPCDAKNLVRTVQWILAWRPVRPGPKPAP
ncbi:MAG: glycosyltransferase family A protein [Elusimicrobiota bacterium]